MAEYTKDTRFSWGWVIGGAVLIWIMQFLALLFMAAAGFNVTVVAALALLAYVIGGFVIGWQSEGRTILEAGLASALVIFVELGRNHAVLAALAPMVLVLTYAIPFVASVFGAWIGEQVQGNVIRTRDD